MQPRRNNKTKYIFFNKKLDLFNFVILIMDLLDTCILSILSHLIFLNSTVNYFVSKTFTFLPNKREKYF